MRWRAYHFDLEVIFLLFLLILVCIRSSLRGMRLLILIRPPTTTMSPIRLHTLLCHRSNTFSKQFLHQLG